MGSPFCVARSGSDNFNKSFHSTSRLTTYGLPHKANKMPSLETVSASDVKPTDVLFCKGLKQFKDHPGCIAFKALIEANVVNYLNPQSESCDKTFLTVDIVERVLVDGGRFLVESDTATSAFVALDKENGRRKVRNAFRNAVTKGGKFTSTCPVTIGFAVQVQSNDRFSSLVTKIQQDPFLGGKSVSANPPSRKQGTKTRKRNEGTKTSSSKRRRHDIVVNHTNELPRLVPSRPFCTFAVDRDCKMDGKWQNALLSSLPTYNTDHLHSPQMEKSFSPLCQFYPNHSLASITNAIQNRLNTPFESRLSNDLSDTSDVLLQHLDRATRLLEDEQNNSQDESSFGINLDMIDNTSIEDTCNADENILANLNLDDLDNFHMCFQDNKCEESSFSASRVGYM